MGSARPPGHLPETNTGTREADDRSAPGTAVPVPGRPHHEARRPARPFRPRLTLSGCATGRAISTRSMQVRPALIPSRSASRAPARPARPLARPSSRLVARLTVAVQLQQGRSRYLPLGRTGRGSLAARGLVDRPIGGRLSDGQRRAAGSCSPSRQARRDRRGRLTRWHACGCPARRAPWRRWQVPIRLRRWRVQVRAQGPAGRSLPPAMRGSAPARTSPASRRAGGLPR
jgi:hypothetical protein